MTKQTEALKLALEALEYHIEQTRPIHRTSEAITAIREALAEQPAPPPECQTEAEKTAFAFGWFKALETVREQPAIKQDLTPEQPAQHQCKFPMCQSEEYQQVLAEQIKRELYTGETAKPQQEGFASPGGGYVPAIPRPMPLDWKLVPRKATPEMLKAMDECAQEGYDERLYAGMASSVYMAAWDASPVMGTLPEQPAQQQEPVAWMGAHDRTDLYYRKPPQADVVPLYTSPPAQRTWVGLTEDEKKDFWTADQMTQEEWKQLFAAIEAKLKEKNT